MISLAEALATVLLTREEDRALAKLEAAVDAALHEKFVGAPVRLEFQQHVEPKIAYALQRAYEERGGWRVQVAANTDVCAFNFSPVFFTPPAALMKTAAQKDASPREAFVAALPPVAMALPPVAALVTVASAISNRRLLVRMPTRSRPKRALEALAAYRSMAGAPIAIEVVLDEDDESMLAADVLQRLNALGCTITIGRHGSKVAACNGGRVREWDVLMLASDDMVPIADGYAARVLRAVEEHFPYLDGAVYFDDGFQGSHICTLPIMGRRLYEQFGYVYAPAYKSLFCDTEQTAVLTAMGRLAYVDEKIIEHRHHVWGKSDKDALYERNDALWGADQAVFEERQKSRYADAQFAFDSLPLRLSLCIATLPVRRARLDRLLDHLYAQIVEHAPRGVEVLVDSREEVTIGEKRQALLERAIGRHVAFIDDDDWIAHDYIERVVAALCREPYADCTSLCGVMTTAGAVPEMFFHSIAHAEWSSSNGVHLRSPNHINAIRRDLALQVGFKELNHAEDHDYSVRLQPLLRREAETGAAPLYYYWYSPNK